MEANKKNTTNEDFEAQAVPMDRRRSFFSLTIVWTGFVFLVTSMMAGGGLAEGLNLTEIIIATLLGNVFLSILAIAVNIQKQVGLNSGQLAKLLIILNQWGLKKS